MNEDLLAAAEDYLARGLSVIALTGKMPNGKVHPHWKDDCFTGLVRTPHWPAGFRHPDTTGIGILTGMPYYVVDIDGEAGAIAWKDIAGDDYMPDRWVARTGRGLHLYVSHFEQFGTVKLADKLDFKGNGGYVAAPPSLHPDGHRYEWLLSPHVDEPPMMMPDALEAILLRRNAEHAARAVDKKTMRVRAPSSFHDGKLYAVATFDGVIKRMIEEPEGNRNAVLYWAARTMLEEGADEEDLDTLLEAAMENGLSRREARRTIGSAVDAQ